MDLLPHHDPYRLRYPDLYRADSLSPSLSIRLIVVHSLEESLSRSLFSRLILGVGWLGVTIHLSRRWSSERLVGSGFLSHSLFAHLIPPYKQYFSNRL